MCSIALRVTACAMLLHLSQVTPGQSCTFTLFKGANLTNINIPQSYFYGDLGLKGCFKKCYETPDCKASIFYGEGQGCQIMIPGKNAYQRDEFYPSEIYTFDRNVSNATCPTVKEWIAQQTNDGN